MKTRVTGTIVTLAALLTTMYSLGAPAIIIR